MNRAHTLIALAAMLSIATGCKGKSDEAKQAARELERTAAATEPEVMEEEESFDSPDDLVGSGGRYAIENKKAAAPSRDKAIDEARASGILVDSDKDAPAAPGAKPAETGAQARAWFPETFLFEPLIVTDDAGVASLSVRVPDRLTTWRLLALAHSRGGAQAGTTTSFLGTLESYVDPVVPPYLYAGDRVRLPIQLVNTTAERIASRLDLAVSGGTLTGGAGAVTIPARGSVIRYATLTASAPGKVTLRAGLGQADAVVETIPVQPTGRRVDVSRGGSLAAPRTLSIDGPTGATAGTDRVTLQVYPGALALLRSELARSADRGGLAHDAFAMLLAGRAPKLLRALGDEPDADALRTLTILTTQRIVRYARTLSAESATLLAQAALTHADNPVLAAIGDRALRFLATNQRPDGTCGGETGWTLQRLLVATADCARAAASQPNVVVRAAGAFARHAEQIDDPYTAAAVLASGAVTGGLKERLRALVRDALVDRPDGSRVLEPPEGAVRADGLAPSTVEATALAVLALDGDPKAPLADMGAALLAGYAPRRGWGDGRTNLVAMQAVLRLFADPVPPDTEIVLSKDGAEVTRGTLTREAVREVLTLRADAAGVAGAHDWKIEATPPVPGLGFSLTVTDWVEWPPAAASGGLELTVEPRGRLAVGRPVELAVSAVAPADQPMTIELALPAGVQTDTGQLDELVGSGAVSSYDRSDGRLVLEVPGQPAAQLFSATVKVIPTLAGRLQSGAASLSAAGGQVFVPPARWNVSPR
jgi:hypothetical protein